MLKKRKKIQSFEVESFDMTPVIDVVFLLIIFFMLVFQFIAADQFKVQVPDRIASAQTAESPAKGPLTITVMPGGRNAIVCAVGAEKLGDVNGSDLSLLVRSAIDESLSSKKETAKTILLRCDKSITFGQVKYILSGIAKSSASTLDWAVTAEK